MLVGACSNRPDLPPKTNAGRELSAAFLAGWVKNLGDALPDRLARLGRKLLGKPPQFLVLGGCGIQDLSRFHCGQRESIQYPFFGQEMGEEIDPRVGLVPLTLT